MGTACRARQAPRWLQQSRAPQTVLAPRALAAAARGLTAGTQVDSMFKGNAGRYINHCCDPNCYCRVVSVDGVKHIVLFAWRDIRDGEEITYDYKLPIEDVKIICHCGAATCRGYLN